MLCDINLFAFYLVTHPNKLLVNYVLQGLKFEFDIGYTGMLGGTRPKNLLSALKNTIGPQRQSLLNSTGVTPLGHLHHIFISPLK